MSEKPLAGQTAVVTGATAGIGLAIARRYRELGATVIGVGRRPALLEQLKTDGIIPLAGDITDPGLIERLLKAAPTIDILVNNAGIVRHAPFFDSKPEDWAAVFEVNVLATMRLTQAVARGMAARKAGHIVMITSALARRVFKYSMAYAATKHALAAFTRGLRIELLPFDIHVTEIAPGLVRTEILGHLDHPDVVANYKKMTFEWIEADDVAQAVVAATLMPARASLDLIEVRPQGQE